MLVLAATFDKSNHWEECQVCQPIGGPLSSTVSTPLNLLGIMKKYLFQLNKYWIIKVRKNHFGDNTNHQTWNQNKARLLILYWWCWWHGSHKHQWTIMTLIIWRRSNPGQAQLSVDTTSDALDGRSTSVSWKAVWEQEPPKAASVAAHKPSVII